VLAEHVLGLLVAVRAELEPALAAAAGDGGGEDPQVGARLVVDRVDEEAGVEVPAGGGVEARPPTWCRSARLTTSKPASQPSAAARARPRSTAAAE
jgi:hypothetical protein